MTELGAPPEFLKYRLPSMAVACPSCDAGIGRECKRPSEHKAMMLHKPRHLEADRLWEIHDLPTITHHRDGTLTYDAPETRPSAQRKATTEGDQTMKTRKTTKARKSAKRAKTTARRKPARANTRKKAARGAARPAPAKRRTKADELIEFLTFVGGRHIDAVCGKFGWLQHSARAAISTVQKPVSKGGRGVSVSTTKDGSGTLYEIKPAA